MERSKQYNQGREYARSVWIGQNIKDFEAWAKTYHVIFTNVMDIDWRNGYVDEARAMWFEAKINNEKDN